MKNFIKTLVLSAFFMLTVQNTFGETAEKTVSLNSFSKTSNCIGMVEISLPSESSTFSNGTYISITPLLGSTLKRVTLTINKADKTQTWAVDGKSMALNNTSVVWEGESTSAITIKNASKSSWMKSSSSQLKSIEVQYIFDINSIPENQKIYYTSKENIVIEPYDATGFGAQYITSINENGIGIMFFDGPVTSIGKMAFAGGNCDKLTSIQIPEGVTQIGGSAFLNTSISSIDIPESVTVIGPFAFSNSDLQSITFNWTDYVPEQIPNNFSKDITIHVPEGYEKLYNKWSTQTSVVGDSRVVYHAAEAIVPNNNTLGNVSIKKSGFDADKQEGYFVMDGTLTTIKEGAFAGKANLTGITLSNKIQCIEAQAFANCETLETIALHSIPQVGANAFDDEATATLELTDASYVYVGDLSNLPAITSATYTRQMSATSVWATLVVPFATESNDNVQLYEFTNVTLTDGAISGLTFTPTQKVAANTPCLYTKEKAEATSITLYAAANADDVVEIQTANVAADPDDMETVTDPMPLYLRGTYTGIGATTGVYYIGANQLWYADNAVSLSPFRAWFEKSNSAEAALSRSLTFSVECEESTSLQSAEASTGIEEKIYDMQGRQHSAPVKGQINLMNGKRIYIKL